MARSALHGRPEWTTWPEAVGLLVRGATARAAWKVALVVGTILSAANQGSVLVGGDATAVTWVRVGFNYCVPYVVASVGFLTACRRPTTGADRQVLADRG